MAAKKTTSKPTKRPDCADCKHSYDPHSPALDGHMILCRCEFEKYSVFMKAHGCEKFTRRH